MFVKVRTIDGKCEQTFDISKLISVEDFKTKVGKEFSIEPDLQRLFYRGKQLENGYTLYHYGVGLGDVLQLVVKSKNDDVSTSPSDGTTKNNENGEKNDEKMDDAESPWFAIGDPVDCLDRAFGAWFEATILNILTKDKLSLIYRVQWKFIEDKDPFDVTEEMIRPRARKLLSYDELSIGQRVMINYNTESPKEVGFWFDLTISSIKKTRTTEELTGTLHIGSDHTTVKNCKVNTRGEIYAIEKKVPLTERVPKQNIDISDVKRRLPLICKHCNDDEGALCKECGCAVCSSKHEPKTLLLCDECDKAYHLTCLEPPLKTIPDDENWYCPKCKLDVNEIVQAGDKLKPTKKKLSSTELKNGQRDWGMGMACVGRTVQCTIVPSNHVGPIPGIEVGMSWEYRLQVSESGVHRPHVAGIHGREAECAYSIVLSGGYEDDVDNGDEFMYTGSGGRDLSGNKRTASQSCDQTLTRMNKALALNCSAKLNTNGATAEKWQNGIPVRVVRSFKLRKRSIFAPAEGNRYDGIYKVVKYFSEKGKSGFSVWRYLLRRDDPTPAPWTKEGRKRIASLGLKMIRYNPTGNPKDENTSETSETTEGADKTGMNKTKAIKRKKEMIGKAKKRKLESYQLDKEVDKLIKDDSANAKLWEECCNALEDGKIVFLQVVAERYTCVCCQEVVYNPVTTPCSHNICRGCIKRSFRAGVYCCPTCRHPMTEDHSMAINESLSAALKRLFPGYGGGR